MSETVIFSTKSKFVRASLKSQVHEGKFKLSHKSIDKTVIQYSKKQQKNVADLTPRVGFIKSICDYRKIE